MTREVRTYSSAPPPRCRFRFSMAEFRFSWRNDGGSAGNCLAQLGAGSCAPATPVLLPTTTLLSRSAEKCSLTTLDVAEPPRPAPISILLTSVHATKIQ